MISKYVCSGSFKGSCGYVLNRKEAEVLAAVGVRSHDPGLMAADFESQRLLHASRHNACFHGILSFHPTENPDSGLMVQIAEAYLKTLGMANTQYVVVRHHDKHHAHMHILANLVDNDGKVVSDKWIGLRGKKAAQLLTLQYGLVQSDRHKTQSQNPQALNRMERTRHEIRNAITMEIVRCRNLEILEKALLAHGITMQFKRRRGTSETQGISFKKGDYSFKGSSVDRRFSFIGLQKIFRVMEQKNGQIALGTTIKKAENEYPKVPGFDSDSERLSTFYPTQRDNNSNYTVTEALDKLERAQSFLGEIWHLATSIPAHGETTYFGHITEDRKKKKRKRSPW